MYTEFLHFFKKYITIEENKKSNYFIMYFSRIFKHIIGILIWLMLLFLIIILYHYSIRYWSWKAETLWYIDNIYAILKIFFTTGFISSIIWVFFYKIRHSRAIDTRLIRRFLPIFNFFITTVIWVVAVFLILEALHINTKNILAWAGIGGALLALASKDLITNLLWSLSILFSRTFEIWDTIRIRTVRLLIEGLVEEITLNHTKVTNKTGEVVYVPNKTIYSESVENLSRRRFFSYDFSIPFAKNVPIEEVEYSLAIIEAKIKSFYPLDIEYTSTNANATDFVYNISVQLPKENKFFEEEMRKFLVNHIFGRWSDKKIPKKEDEYPVITNNTEEIISESQ